MCLQRQESEPCLSSEIINKDDFFRAVICNHNDLEASQSQFRFTTWFLGFVGRADDMLIPLDLVGLINVNVPTVYAMAVIFSQKFRFAFGQIAVYGLPSLTLFTSRHKVPREWFTDC